jgi:glutathione synthase/RimK-type ligase-like ATP-grasp enzyme
MTNSEKFTFGFLEYGTESQSEGELVELPPCAMRRIHVEEILLDSGPQRLFYRDRPLREWADVFVPYFVVDASTADRFCMTIGRALELEGIPTLNSQGVYALCGDKYLTTSLAKKLGVQTADSVMFLPSDATLAASVTMIERRFSYPFVLKPRGMLKGIAVLRITDRDQLLSNLQLYIRAGILPLVQELVTPAGEDVRLYFVGNEFQFAYRRRNPTSFMSNFRRIDGIAGAKVQRLCEVPPRIVEASTALVTELGADYVSCDWLPKGEGDAYVLNEVEATPGLDSLAPQDQLQIAERLTRLGRRKISRDLPASRPAGKLDSPPEPTILSEA